MTTLPSTDPTVLITVTRLGHTFKASRRTVAHLDSTIAAFEEQFPDANLTMLQSCYNTDVKLSAGTHDMDVCFDFGFEGVLVPGGSTQAQWLRLQRFLRAHGWGCWWRHTGPWASSSAFHVHGFSLPVGLKIFTTKVGKFIDGGVSQYGHVIASSQLVDYLDHAEGLAGEHVQNEDKTWFPPFFTLTVFRYNAWIRKHGVPK